MKRYEIEHDRRCDVYLRSEMAEDHVGEYVKYEDVAELEAENVRLMDALKLIVRHLDKGERLEARMGEHSCKTIAREALLAKEEKPNE
jgi:hypothetical protein